MHLKYVLPAMLLINLVQYARIVGNCIREEGKKTCPIYEKSEHLTNTVIRKGWTEGIQK
jgi:hypothetical protein